MPRITSVEPQKKTLRLRSGQVPRRFNIFLDGEFAFGADEDLVVTKRLVVGKELTIADVEALIKETEVGKLMEKMYRLFSIRQRTEKEIRDYFKNLSFKRKLKDQQELSYFIIDTVVQLMKRKGMINDEEFAKAWVESRSKKKGIKVIKGELMQKGVNKEIIDEILNDSNHLNSVNATIVAEKLLNKKIEVWKNLSVLELKKKAYEFLLRRGFEYDLVKEIVEKFLQKR